MLVVEFAAIVGACLVAALILWGSDREHECDSPIEWSQPFTDDALHEWIAAPYDQEKDAA